MPTQLDPPPPSHETQQNQKVDARQGDGLAAGAVRSSQAGVYSVVYTSRISATEWFRGQEGTDVMAGFGPGNGKNTSPHPNPGGGGSANQHLIPRIAAPSRVGGRAGMICFAARGSRI